MHYIPFLLSHRVVLNYLRLCEQVRVSATVFRLYHNLWMSLSACLCSKTGLPDPDCIFRNTVPSETCNWDEFTATPVQALADTSFKKSFSGAQLPLWGVLQLSLWRDMMLPALDNSHLPIIVTSAIELHHQAPFLAAGSVLLHWTVLIIWEQTPHGVFWWPWCHFIVILYCSRCALPTPWAN